MLRRENFLLLLLLIIAAIALVACDNVVTEEHSNDTGLTKNSDGYVDIDVDQLNNMMDDKNFALVNVHIPYAGDIPETDTSIPFDKINANLTQLPGDKDAPIVIYCRSGNMSTQAAETLVGLGYTNIMEVDGGMNAWQSAGYELLANQ